MELDICIKGRRSVRSYTDEPVSKEQVEAVLEAGIWAPYARTLTPIQPCRFIVIENRELIKYVSDEAKAFAIQMFPDFANQVPTVADPVCYNAPVLILICTEENQILTDTNLLASALAAENMFLKAHELGLGTCFMGLVLMLKSNPDVLKKIGVPENYEIMVPFILGHPKTKQEAGMREKPTVLKWIE